MHKSISQRDVRFIFASIPSKFIAMFGSFCFTINMIPNQNRKLLIVAVKLLRVAVY